MTIQVTGRNIETGEAFQIYVTDKAKSVLEKYIGSEIFGHVRVEKERSQFRTDCSIRLRTGLLLEAHGTGDDAYQSADQALAHLEKPVRRYKRRLKNHHGPNGADHGTFPAASSSGTAGDYLVRADDEAAPDDAAGPVIVAETERQLREMTVSHAVMQLDLTEDPVLVFRNAANGSLNVVYRRNDGNIGWIEPAGGNAKTD